MPRKCRIPNFFARRGISCDHLPDYVYDQAQQIIKRMKVARTSNTKESHHEIQKACIILGICCIADVTYIITKKESSVYWKTPSYMNWAHY